MGEGGTLKVVLILGLVSSMIVNAVVLWDNRGLRLSKEELDKSYRDLKASFDELYCLQEELAETNAEYNALQQSYNKLEEKYEDLEAKHFDFVRVYKVKSFTLSNLNIAPKVIELGRSVTISFCITNIHNESRRFGIAVLIEGPDYGHEIWDSTTVGGYETKKISYIEFPEVVGNFTVTIGGLKGSFVVTQVG